MNNAFKIKGLKELDQFLQLLPLRIEKNIKRGMLRAAGEVYKRAAIRNVSSVSGDLAKSIRITTRLNKKKGTIDAAVKAGATKRVPGPFYAHFVEFGTRPHLISVPDNEKQINKRLSRKRGKVVRESLTTINRRSLRIAQTFVGPVVKHPGAKAHPFMRPAFDSESQNAIKAAGEYVKKRLNKRRFRVKQGIDVRNINIEVGE